MNLSNLAQRATHALLRQRPIAVTHHAGWQRDGFPLPIKRMGQDVDGTTTQEYRPLAILEFVHEVLSGEMAQRRANDRKVEKEETA